MIRKLSRQSCGRYLAVLALCGAGTVGAQNTPEMREVLKRLDRLEQDNRSLSEEVHALRKELAGVRAPTRASAAEVASDGQGVAGPAAQQSAERQSAEQQSAEQQSADERLDVQQSRLDEMAQTKVESSQKFPLRITGMALFNASVNGRHNNDADNPTTASLVPEDLTGGGTLRQSTIGLLFDGPKTFGGAKVSGSFYMDFFGGSTASLNHLVRLRTAGIHLDWANTSMMAGQDKPLISPRDPESLAQVGVSPLTSAGNPWLWQPQVRLEQRFGLGSYGGVVAQLAVYQTSFLTATSDVDIYVPATERSRPGAEGRLQLWRRWGETGRLEIAGGIHANRNRVGQVAASTNVYSMDWFFRPWAKLEFSGMFFHGRNVAVLGALRPGFTVFPGGRIVPVRSNGGWGQMRIPITSRVAFNFYGGQQSNYEADILAGNISSNAAYFANVMYRFAPNVILSFEGGQVRTNYFRIGTRLNDHYDLAIAYLF